MNLDEYQKLAKRTLTIDPDRHDQLIATCALGLAGESGEVVEHVKKFFGHGHELSRHKLAAELGDVLWYVAALATLCDLDLSTVASLNVEKLRARYPEGFDPKRSQERAE